MLDSRDPVCKVKLVGMVAFIFLSGVAAGGFGWEVARRTWFRPALPAAILSTEAKIPVLDHFSRELDLTEHQTRAIESILDEFIMEQADIMSRFRTSRASGHDRIYQVLNAEQRKRLRKVLEELNNQQQH